MFVEPLMFIVILFFKMVFLFIKIVAAFFKKGLGWVAIAFILYVIRYSYEANGLQICIAIAIGGTAIHFLLKAGIRKLKINVENKSDSNVF